MKSHLNHTSIYLNATLADIRKRAKKVGENMTGELTHIAMRYEAVLSDCVPDIPEPELAVLRRLFASQPRLPLIFTKPKVLAAKVENEAQPGQDSEETLRLTYSLARRIARLSVAECLALVENTERYVRNPVIKVVNE